MRVLALLRAYEHGGFGTVCSVMRAVGVLAVAAVAPLAPAAALRDTSAIFAMLIAVLWLRERFSAARAAALGMALVRVVAAAGVSR